MAAVQREPLFNIPPVVTFLVAVFVIVHVGRLWFLNAEQNQYLLDLFAFIPARYDNTYLLGDILPGGFGAEVWTFFSYSLIHASWLHLGVNVDLVPAVRQRDRAPFRPGALSRLLRRYRCGWRDAASVHAWR